MIALNEAGKAALLNAKKRQTNGANIQSDSYHILKHCATEVIEATDALSNLYFGYSIIKDEPKGQEKIAELKEQYASELADIICCVLISAANEGIDIEKAIMNCLVKNKKRAEGKGDKA